MTIRPRDTSRCAACACCVRVTGPTVRLIPWCQRIVGFQGKFLYAVRDRVPCPRHLYVSPRRRRARDLTMIKLFSLKQAKKDGESPKAGTQKKASAAQLRITKGSDTPPEYATRPARRFFFPLTRPSFFFRHKRAQSPENVRHGIPGSRRFAKL